MAERADSAALLAWYGSCWDSEAGPWNLSVENKYLEYMFARFYEENFSVPAGAAVCNIGIGAGAWDRYLSYRLNGGILTSVDIDPQCCAILRAGLANENNPNPVTVLCADASKLEGLDGRFDIVTMVGSTRLESGGYAPILQKAFGLLKRGGSLYYQSLDGEEPRERFEALCAGSGMMPEKYLLDTAYNIRAQYWKVRKP